MKERIVYFDYLRVIAAFAVMILHISAQNWYSTDVSGFEWQVFSFYDSIARWGVPIFVMISGSLFLGGHDIPLRKLYSKYIRRLLTAFITWSLIYAAVDGGGVKEVIVKTIRGHYHMWFLLMMIGLYMCVPVIDLLVGKGRKTRYFLVWRLSLLFSCRRRCRCSEISETEPSSGLPICSAQIWTK